MDEVIDELKHNKQFRKGLQPLQPGGNEGSEPPATPSESPSASLRDAETPKTPTEEQTSSADEAAPTELLPASIEGPSSRQEEREQTEDSSLNQKERDAQKDLRSPTTAATSSEASALKPQVNVSCLINLHDFSSLCLNPACKPHAELFLLTFRQRQDLRSTCFCSSLAA